MNIYHLTDHLTPQQTQDTLVFAVVLGVAGLLLSQPQMLQWLYVSVRGLFGAHVPTSSIEYAAGRNK